MNLNVVDINTISFKEGGSPEQLTSNAEAIQKAAEAGATYVIVGNATAVKASQSVAYGVNVVRSSAEITARIIRVSDGKVLKVEESSAQSGGQAQRAAGQAALKEAGQKIAYKLAAAAKAITNSP